MFRKSKFIAFVMLCILFTQPVYAGTVHIQPSDSAIEYTYYKVFDVTRENEVGWRRVCCNYDCDLVFYGFCDADENGTLPWMRDDEAELLSNHCASLVGIDNDHARSSTLQVTYDERWGTMDGPLVWKNGKIKISNDKKSTLHYFMYYGSPWIKVVRKYAKKAGSGITLKACRSPYKNEIGLYVVTFDAKFDASKFQTYLYDNIPSDALLAVSTTKTIQNVPIGYYIVKARYENGEAGYIGDFCIEKVKQSTDINDNDTILGTDSGITILSVKMQKGASRGRSVEIKWEKAKQAKKYVIYRSTKKNSGYTKIAEVKKKKTSYVDKKVKKGKAYYYKVAAKTKDGIGLMSKASKKVKCN